MTVTELLTQLNKDVITVMGDPYVPNGADNSGPVKTYKINILQETGLNKALKGTFNYFVLNEGVVAGPQVDENGDPVLDANGDQVVIAAEDAEQAFAEQALELPKEKNEKGMTFMASKVMDGTISSFRVVDTKPDLGPFSYFDVEVMENIRDESGDIVGFVGTKKLWRVQETADGTATFYVVEE